MIHRKGFKTVKGPELYLQIYQWDPAWLTSVEEYDLDITSYGIDDARVNFARQVNSAGAVLSGLSVGGTFAYLFGLIR